MNPKTMLKQELVDYLTFRCVHRHNAIDHPACYQRWLKANKPEKIGFLDIESGGSLDADWGQVICWRIKKLDGPIIGDEITREEQISLNPKKRIRDKRIVKSFCEQAAQFTRLVVYYGKDQQYRHDLPFLRTQAVIHNLFDFPMWKQIEVVDLYDIIKGKFKFSKRGMAIVCKSFGIPAKEIKVYPKDWLDALSGIPEAIKKICQHCDEDVTSTELLYKKIFKYKGTKTTT